MDESELDVAAEQRLTLFEKPPGDRCSERADDVDRGCSESQTDDEDPQALKSRAQIPERQPEPQARVHRSAPATILPSRTSAIRSQRWATTRSCVMSRSVALCSRRSA